MAVVITITRDNVLHDVVNADVNPTAIYSDGKLRIILPFNEAPMFPSLDFDNLLYLFGRLWAIFNRAFYGCRFSLRLPRYFSIACSR